MRLIEIINKIGNCLNMKKDNIKINNIKNTVWQSVNPAIKEEPLVSAKVD